QVTLDDYSGQLKVRGKSIKTLLEVRQSRVHYLQVNMKSSDFNVANGSRGFTHNFKQLLESSLQGGQCPVKVTYQREDAKGVLTLGDDWQVLPSDDLIERLKDRFGAANVQLRYD
ncbi:MAG: DNA polymerase-3 subunit alpha, partial [Oceanicoccus sp.]